MNQDQYDLVFSGQLVPGCELAQVKNNVQALFRIDEGKVQILFSGKAITLKKSLALDVATKYRVAMKKAGARVDLVLCKEQKPAATPAPTQSPAQVAAKAKAAATSSGFSTVLGAQPMVADEPRPEIEAPDFGVAAVGGDLLQSGEKAVVEAVEVDISQLSVAPQAGNLVDESELFHLDPVDVIIPDLGVAPVGSDVLEEGERKKVEPVKVDISALSVADVGEGGKLSPDTAAPPPAPDVTHIKLED